MVYFDGGWFHAFIRLFQIRKVDVPISDKIGFTPIGGQNKAIVIAGRVERSADVDHIAYTAIAAQGSLENI